VVMNALWRCISSFKCCNQRVSITSRLRAVMMTGLGEQQTGDCWDGFRVEEVTLKTSGRACKQRELYLSYAHAAKLLRLLLHCSK
jgi:hypothetical protein